MGKRTSFSSWLLLISVYSVLMVPSIEAGAETAKKNIAPSDDGFLEIDGVVKAKFQKATFKTQNTLELALTKSKESSEDFNVTAGAFFKIGSRLPFEIVVRTGKVKPLKPIEMKIAIPPSLLEKLPAGAKILPFVQYFQDGGQEILDNFEVEEASISKNGRELTLSLTPAAFTDRRSKDKGFEAVVVVGTVMPDSPQ